MVEVPKYCLDIAIVSVRKEPQANRSGAGQVFVLQGPESGFGTGGVALAGEQVESSRKEEFVLVTDRDRRRDLGEEHICLLDSMALSKSSDEPELQWRRDVD
jgi:hypothetical protein